MQRKTFRHLDRTWEATLPDAPGDHQAVLFRNAADDDPQTYEARIHREELSDPEADEETALRRGLESALVLDALEDHEAGLTAEELGRMTGMPAEAAEDRLDVLDRVQPVLETSGPRRYRTKLLTTVIVLLAAAGACADSGGDDPELGEAAGESSAMDATVPVDGAEVPAFSTEVRTEFQPGGGADGTVAGTLRLLVPTDEAPRDEAMRLAVELAGLEPGPHAWHVHRGSCDVAGAGEILIPFTPTADQEGIAQPLVADDEGRASAEVPVPPLNALQTQAGSYSVHVHREAGVEHGPSVACANL